SAGGAQKIGAGDPVLAKVVRKRGIDQFERAAEAVGRRVPRPAGSVVVHNVPANDRAGGGRGRPTVHGDSEGAAAGVGDGEAAVVLGLIGAGDVDGLPAVVAVLGYGDGRSGARQSDARDALRGTAAGASRPIAFSRVMDRVDAFAQ